MQKIEMTIDIERPVAEVFAYVTDFNKAPDWVSVVVETKKADPPGPGAKAVQVAKFLGRRWESTNEVVEYEANRRFAWKSEKPMKVAYRAIFDPIERGTRVHVSIEAEVSGFFKVAEPLVAVMAKRQTASDMGNLKQLLEAGGAASRKSV